MSAPPFTPEEVTAIVSTLTQQSQVTKSGCEVSASATTSRSSLSGSKAAGTIQPSVVYVVGFFISVLGTALTPIIQVTRRHEPVYDPTLEDWWHQEFPIHEADAVIDYEYFPFSGVIGGYVSQHFNVASKNADALFLLFAVDDRNSFTALQSFYENSILESQFASSIKDTPIWVMANKSDLPRKDWQVTPEEGAAFANRLHARARFANVSARTREGLDTDDIRGIVKRVILDRIEAAKTGTGEAMKEDTRETAATKDRWSLICLSENFKRLIRKGLSRPKSG